MTDVEKSKVISDSKLKSLMRKRYEEISSDLIEYCTDELYREDLMDHLMGGKDLCGIELTLEIKDRLEDLYKDVFKTEKGPW